MLRKDNLIARHEGATDATGKQVRDTLLALPDSAGRPAGAD